MLGFVAAAALVVLAAFVLLQRRRRRLASALTQNAKTLLRPSDSADMPHAGPLRFLLKLEVNDEGKPIMLGQGSVGKVGCNQLELGLQYWAIGSVSFGEASSIK